MPAFVFISLYSLISFVLKYDYCSLKQSTIAAVYLGKSKNLSHQSLSPVCQPLLHCKELSNHLPGNQIWWTIVVLDEFIIKLARMSNEGAIKSLYLEIHFIFLDYLIPQ